jgi:hypothetical protein
MRRLLIYILIQCLFNSQCLSTSQDGLEELMTQTNGVYNPYFVVDVWETCFTTKSPCKKLLSRIHMKGNGTNKIEKDPSLLNLVENVLFVRSNENVNNVMSKYSTIFRSFLEMSNKIENSVSPDLPGGSQKTLTPVKLWKDTILAMSEVYSQQKNTAVELYPIHPQLLNEIALLFHKFHVNMLVNEITVFGQTIPRKFIFSETDQHSHQKRDDQQTPSTVVNVQMCPSNTYSVWNPQTNNYDCICYADKNCHVTTQSICENESLHPLLLISTLIILALLICFIYLVTCVIVQTK